jgi:4-amino-4-deoxy-L-arabinose transferase-like glycosyltransferase
MPDTVLLTAMGLTSGIALATVLRRIPRNNRLLLPVTTPGRSPLSDESFHGAKFAAPKKRSAKSGRKTVRRPPPAPEPPPPAPAPPPVESGPADDTERRRTAGALVCMGFLFGLLSLYLHKDLPADNSNSYLPFLAIGMLMFSGGMLMASRPDRKSFFEPLLEWIALKMGIRPVQFVCLVSGVLSAALATVAAGVDPLMISPLVAIISWILGIVLVVLGGWVFAPASERKRLPKDALLWAAGLTLAAFLLRAVLIGQIPVMLGGDEGSTGMDALQFRDGGINNPFGIFGWHPFPALYFFIESLGVAVFGRTAEALRLPSALAGALTVGGLYLLVRSMYSHRHGLAAAIFLCALHLHMHFSRLGVMNIWDGLWYLITLGALWYGWQSGKRAYWIVAGLAMGFGQYFYATTRTLFVAVPLFLVLATILDRAGWRRNLRNLIPALAALAATLLPLAHYVATHTDQYLADMKTNSIFGTWMEIATRESGLPAWRIVLKQLGLGFGGFVTVNLSFWYRPDTPVLRTLPAVFFLFGLLILLFRLKDLRTWIPLLWLAAYGMTVSLSESTPAAQRLAGVGAACALVVGFGAVEFAATLFNLLPSRRQLAGVAAILLVGVMAADDLRFYFFDYTPQSVYLGKYDFVGTGGEVAKQIVLQLKDQPGEWEVVFFNNSLMGFYSDPALRFLLPNAEGMDINDAWGSPENPPLPDRNLFFVFMPEREEEIPRVLAQLPGGTLGEVHATDGSLLYTYYEYRLTP